MVVDNMLKVIRTSALSSLKKEYHEISNQKTDVLIIMTAHNEAENIEKVIDSINSLNLSSYKILVINDGSSDETEKVVREKGVMVLTHMYNLGIGAAVKTGFLASRLFHPKIIINIDGDGQMDPKYIPQIISLIENEDADLVYASRFAKDSKFKTTVVRTVGNKFYANLVNKIGKISLTDVLTGNRGIKYEKLSSVFFLSENNFAIELAIRAGKNKLKIKEITAPQVTREYGESQFHRIENFLVYNWNALVQIFNAVFRKAKFD